MHVGQLARHCVQLGIYLKHFIFSLLKTNRKLVCDTVLSQILTAVMPICICIFVFWLLRYFPILLLLLFELCMYVLVSSSVFSSRGNGLSKLLDVLKVLFLGFFAHNTYIYSCFL